MEIEGAVRVLREAAMALRTAGEHGPSTDTARALMTARNALDAALADTLASIRVAAGHEAEGASSITGWARRELRISAGETWRLIAASETMDALPEVREAAQHGQVTTEHVAAFTYARRHVGEAQTAQSTRWLLDVALTCEPKELRDVARELRAAIHPDELEEAWIKGMAKRDITVNPVPDGWHVNGFLDIATGAKLKAILESLSVPREANDQRTAAERRIDGLCRLLDSVLENGLPSDKGVRPQMSVLVDAETLSAATTHHPGDPAPAPTVATPPAELIGFGPISGGLLSQISCNADFTALLIDRNKPPSDTGHVLDVGRTKRLATRKQRLAVLARQRHRCANPGCTNTHLEMHHATWWSRGGTTNVKELIGYCVGCHHLVHAGLLTVERVGGELVTRHPATHLSSRIPRTELRQQAWEQRITCSTESLPRAG
ncbi:HNH endonuclease signature motif containing protein [Aeromicrobium sp. Leaf350]|uniref:HNH endonuclease n=1 Tax=Aeromicrobium sp. Leaf350 TaxID=2876565 RepID=UPI001E4181E8|nr:HNH endonuclease signature motif containing protein [Aeromicrobium sp. Leaf350]